MLMPFSGYHKGISNHQTLHVHQTLSSGKYKLYLSIHSIWKLPHIKIHFWGRFMVINGWPASTSECINHSKIVSNNFLQKAK